MGRRHRKALIPAYAVLPLLTCFTVNGLVYCVTARIADGWKHYNLMLAIDRAVPLIPAFVSVYLGCYVFWIVNYILIVRQGKETCMRFVTADLMSRLICCFFYLALPTMNVRPVLSGNGIWTAVLQGVYCVDRPVNLFPSIHCLASWFCYIGIRKNKKIPGGYRIFSCVFAILVFVSTQVTKQHYIVDVAGGIAVAELTYYIALHTECWRVTERVFCRMNDIVFSRRKGKSCGKESGFE